jgi:hypothetical protein
LTDIQTTINQLKVMHIKQNYIIYGEIKGGQVQKYKNKEKEKEKLMSTH